MELESDSLLNQFSDRDMIKRTPQNEVEFASFEERGLVRRTLNGCWLLTPSGRQALNERSEREMPAKSVPPVFDASSDGPER